MGRKYRSTTVSVDIDIAEILCDLDDETIKEEYLDRFGKEPLPAASFDMFDEVHWHLIGGRVQYALALIESAQNARLITEEARQKQFQLEHPVQ